MSTPAQRRVCLLRSWDGRPKRQRVRQLTVFVPYDCAHLSSGEPTPAESEGDEPAPIVKKRGRPPKAKTDASPGGTSSPTLSFCGRLQVCPTLSAGERSVSVKKRGRPPKVKAEASTGGVDSASASFLFLSDWLRWVQGRACRRRKGSVLPKPMDLEVWTTPLHIPFVPSNRLRYVQVRASRRRKGGVLLK